MPPPLLLERYEEAHQPPLPNASAYENYRAAGWPAAPYSFLKSSEGLRLQAYDDATGKPLAAWEMPKWVATIGYGATSINGKPIQPGQIITAAEADKLFNEQIPKYQNWKNLTQSGSLTPSQHEALTSFEYNLWPGIWKKNAMPILDAVNKWDFNWAWKLMQQYAYAQGKYVPGLANRRAKEAQLLLA